MASADVMRDREDIERAIAGQTLCHLLRDVAERHGGDPALSSKVGDSWRTLTWREVRERAAEAAVGLSALGVGRGDTVAIMAANRPEHVLADMGIVHAGATATTLYSTLAPDQIRYIADHCSAKVAILENRDVLKRWSEVREDLGSLEHVVLLEHAEEFDDVMSWDDLLESGRRVLEEDPGRFETLWQQVEPDDTVTLIYTSGTTGPPKGVPITHRNVLYEAEALDRITGLPDGIVGLSYLPLAHIAERATSIYMSVKKASHVYCCPDVSQVLEYVQEARPQLFFAVPRVWEKVQAGITAKIAAEEGAKASLARSALRTGRGVVRLRERGKQPGPWLRAEHALLEKLVLSKIREGLGLDRCQIAVSSAAPLSPDVAEFFAGIGLPLIEAWGMTELTGAATFNPMEGWRIGTVGLPLPGIEVRLAPDDQEVLVRGPIAVAGYHRMPEETAALLDDEGWLHTGDVGQIDGDGHLRIVDRKKELIITAGGKNISPANIESLLKAHPLVGQALAYGDSKPFVGALIVLDHEVAPAWAAQHGITDTSTAALAEHPDVQAEIEQAVAAANDRLSRAEQVKRHRILPAEWTLESEELTPTMKLKRRVIHDKYRDDIEALYT